MNFRTIDGVVHAHPADGVVKCETAIRTTEAADRVYNAVTGFQTYEPVTCIECLANAPRR